MKMKFLAKTMACALSFALALSAVPTETIKAEENISQGMPSVEEQMTNEVTVSFSRDTGVKRTWLPMNEYVYNADGTAKSHTDYEYDERGNCTTYISYTGTGTSDKDVDYICKETYDAQDNKTSSSYEYYIEGKKDNYFKFTYNADGKMVTYESVDYNEDGSVERESFTENLYNAKGVCEESNSYLDGEHLSVDYNTYDESGTKLLKSEVYLAKSKNLISVVTYEYEGDNVIRKNQYEVWQGEQSLWCYNLYEYDEHGNEIKDQYYLVDSDGTEKLSTEKVYTYVLLEGEYEQASYLKYEEGTLNTGWVDEYDENGNTVKTTNYGKGGAIDSYQYYGDINHSDAAIGEYVTTENITSDANGNLIEKEVVTYMLFSIEGDETTEEENTSLNGLKQASDGNWYKYVNGEIDRNYTGLYCDETVGWWLVEDGQVAFDYNGLYGDANYGWWLVSGGAVNFEYIGLYCDANVGWWLVGGGRVCFEYNGLWGDQQYGWWLVEGGTVNFGYTGLYCDANVGWWLVGGGRVCFEYNDLWGDPQYGWWLVEGGAPSFEFTGLVQYGGNWWYVEGGAVNFNFTGQVTANDGTYNVVNGCVVF